MQLIEARYFQSKSMEFWIGIYVSFYQKVFRHHQYLFQKCCCINMNFIFKRPKPILEKTLNIIVCAFTIDWALYSHTSTWFNPRSSPTWSKFLFPFLWIRKPMLEEILEFTWLINDRGFVVKSFSRIFSHDCSYLWQVLELKFLRWVQS